jgi:hypothetical protein
MEPTFNPYAPPQSHNPYAPETGDIFRQKMLLIIPRDSAPCLPCDTCVKCGRPAVKSLKRRLFWHSPGYYLLILLNLLLYLIVALIVRKQLRVTLGLCGIHSAVRRRWILSAWVSFFASIGLFVMAIETRGEGFTYGMSGGGALLASLVLACIASNQTIRPRRINGKRGNTCGRRGRIPSTIPCDLGRNRAAAESELGSRGLRA